MSTVGVGHIVEVGGMRGSLTQKVPSPLLSSLNTQDGRNIPATSGEYNKGEMFASVIDSEGNKL